MRGIWSYSGLLLTLAHLSYQVTGQDQNNYYTAAVVEFPPTFVKGNAVETLMNNTQMYKQYIAEAKQQNADIIVFPEDGLTTTQFTTSLTMNDWSTVIPAANEGYIPCTGNRSGISETLKQLSCAARNNSIYVVINIAERETCQRGSNSKCSSSGTIYHNTNTVFDRTGKIIARYRKVNLYMESNFSTTESPEIVTFDTDFGVTFGTFICFDILFATPALNLTRKEGVTHIVYSTAWFSEIPFLTAAQTQFAWAYAEDVNLLAAGYSKPSAGNTGSGIYLGRRGIANVTFNGNPAYRLLVSRVPKTSSGKPRTEDTHKDTSDATSRDFYRAQSTETMVDEISLLRDNITQYESLPLNGSMNETICHRGFCCDFKGHATLVNSSINYRAVVYNGIVFYGREVKCGIRVCAMVQCSNNSIASCGVAKRSDIAFNDLRITTKLVDYQNLLTMPSLLNSMLLPLEQFTYTERMDKNTTTLTLALNKTSKDLVTFGFYVRDFSRDEWLTGVASTSIVGASIFVALLSIFSMHM